MSKKSKFWLGAALLGVIYLPSAFLRQPFVPDELRNFTVALNIKSLKDFFILHFSDWYYFDKPPLYFWLLKGFTFFRPLLLPASIGLNIAALIITAAVIVRMSEEVSLAASRLSVIIFFSTPIVLGMGFIARMDLLFLCFISGAFYFIWKTARKEKFLNYLLYGVCVFLAVFTKGALGFFIPFLSGLILLPKKGKFLAANFTPLGLIALWFFIGWHFIGREFINQMLFVQTLHRAFSPLSHSQPFWIFFLWLGALFFLWIVFIAGYFWHRLRKHNHIDIAEKIFLVWALVSAAVLLTIKSKLAIYLLLLAPPAAFFTAYFIIHYSTSKSIAAVSAVYLFLFLGGFIFSFFSIPHKYRIPATITVLIVGSFYGAVFFAKKRENMIKLIAYGWIMAVFFLSVTVMPLRSRRENFEGLAKTVKEAQKKYGLDTVFVDKDVLYGLKFYGVKNIAKFSAKNKNLNLCGIIACYNCPQEEKFITIKKVYRYKVMADGYCIKH